MIQPEWQRPVHLLVQTLMRDGAAIQSDMRSYALTMDDLLDPGTLAGGGHTSGPSDPTVAIVMQRERYRDNWERVYYSLTEAAGLLGIVRKAMSEIERTARADQLAAASAAARCSATDKKGVDEWGGADLATCEDHAVKDGLCNKHYMRYYRWQKGEAA